MQILRLRFVILVCVLLVIALPQQTSQAATINVGCNANLATRVTDLINAFNTANGTVANDTIVLSASCVYTLTAVNYVANGNNGLPSIPSTAAGGNLVILGNNATIRRDNAAPSFRIFRIANSGNLIIANLNISNGVSTAVGGGGFLNGSGNLSLINSRVLNNSAGADSGGGIYNNNGSVGIDESRLVNNTAATGGGIYSNGGTVGVTNSTLDDNDATTARGGGIYSINADVVVAGSTFAGNTAVNQGGGIANISGMLEVTNSTFTTNSANDGGGIYDENGTTTLIFGTLSGNTAVNEGGGIFPDGGTVTLTHTLVAGNAAATGDDISGTITSTGYNLIGSSSGVSGLDASDLADGDATPLNLGALADNGGLTRTMALLAGSVAINAGDPNYTPPPDYDQRGMTYPRIRDGQVDIGAYEFLVCPSFPALIANEDVPGLIAAIDCANLTTTNETINLVTGGTYTFTESHNEGMDSSGGSNALPLIKSTVTSGQLALGGGYASLIRDPAAQDFRILSVEADGNLYLNKVNLVGGSEFMGGAVYSDGTILAYDTAYTGNAGDSGGVFYANSGSDVTVQASTFDGNVANVGGAFSCTSFSIISLRDNTFSDNVAASSGGAVYCDAAAIVSIFGSTFSNNTGADFGGAVYQIDSSFSISNSTFYGNFSAGEGGAVYSSGETMISHSTIVGNTALNGGGIYQSSASLDILSLANTLIAGNTAATGPDISGAITSDGYNLIRMTGGMTGNVATDLVNAAATPLNLGVLADNGGLTQTVALLADSAAINAGDPAIPFLTTDQRGTGFPRVNDGRLDIGAFESDLTSLNVILALQGRTAPPNTQWVITAHVEVRPADENDDRVLVESDYVSSTFGQFTIPDLTVGSYRVWIKGTHSLAQESLVTLTSGSNALLMPTMLEGDANDSNAITISDFSILATAFGTVFGGAGYDARADFNQDGLVSISDFSLLASNFGQVGD